MSNINLQELLSDLREAGLKPEDICKRIGHRVSKRTIYRWLSKESEPKQKAHIEALQKLHKRVLTKNT